MYRTEFEANAATFQCARALSAARARSTGNFRVAMILALASVAVLALLVSAVLRML